MRLDNKKTISMGFSDLLSYPIQEANKNTKLSYTLLLDMENAKEVEEERGCRSN